MSFKRNIFCGLWQLLKVQRSRLVFGLAENDRK
jgi:hypothetical protein